MPQACSDYDSRYSPQRNTPISTPHSQSPQAYTAVYAYGRSPCGAMHTTPDRRWRIEQHIDQCAQLIARGTKAEKYLQQIVHHGKKHGSEKQPARFFVVERGVWLEKARRQQQQCHQRHHRHSTGLKDQQIIGNYHISIFHATKRQEHTTRTPLSISHISAKI